MQPIINQAMWCSLSNEVRFRIRSIFGIPRSGNTSVLDGKIESDGTTNEDLKHLQTDKMQEYLGKNSDNFYQLFDEIVAKVNDDILKGLESKMPPKESETTVTIPTKIYEEIINANKTNEKNKPKKKQK